MLEKLPHETQIYIELLTSHCYILKRHMSLMNITTHIPYMILL